MADEVTAKDDGKPVYNLNLQKDREMRIIELLEQGVNLLTHIARNTQPEYSKAVRIKLDAKPIDGQEKEQT